MSYVRLLGFPMPPSANRLHLNRTGPGKNRRKSPEYRAYDRDVALWAIKNRQDVAKGALFAAALPAQSGLILDYSFCFPHGRLISKTGSLKRLDVDNRIKACADAVARVLAFDDSQIISGRYEKVAIKGAKEPFVTIKISVGAIPTEVRSLLE